MNSKKTSGAQGTGGNGVNSNLELNFEGAPLNGSGLVSVHKLEHDHAGNDGGGQEQESGCNCSHHREHDHAGNGADDQGQESGCNGGHHREHGHAGNDGGGREQESGCNCGHHREHEHTHHHEHHGLLHHHHHEPINVDGRIRRVLYFSIAINLFYVVVEALYGWKFNSLGLISDAGHNLSDVFSMLLALLASFLALVQSRQNFTYGFKKSTILISLVNAIILVGAVVGIVYESLQRLHCPEVVDGTVVSFTAGVGIFVNGLTVYLLNKNRGDDLNVAGAFWHMLADTLVSLGVVVSGIIIAFTNLYVIDTIISLVVAVIIVISSWEFLGESLRLALDGVPNGIDPQEVERECLAVEGVEGIHHLHIWALSTRHNALTAHVVLAQGYRGHRVKQDLRELLGRMKIHHVTLELEESGEQCSSSEGCCSTV